MLRHAVAPRHHGIRAKKKARKVANATNGRAGSGVGSSSEELEGMLEEEEDRALLEMLALALAPPLPLIVVLVLVVASVETTADVDGSSSLSGGKAPAPHHDPTDAATGRIVVVVVVVVAPKVAGFDAGADDHEDEEA